MTCPDCAAPVAEQTDKLDNKEFDKKCEMLKIVFQEETERGILERLIMESVKNGILTGTEANYLLCIPRNNLSNECKAVLYLLDKMGGWFKTALDMLETQKGVK